MRFLTPGSGAAGEDMAASVTPLPAEAEAGRVLPPPVIPALDPRPGQSVGQPAREGVRDPLDTPDPRDARGEAVDSPLGSGVSPISGGQQSALQGALQNAFQDPFQIPLRPGGPIEPAILASADRDRVSTDSSVTAATGTAGTTGTAGITSTAGTAGITSAAGTTGAASTAGTAGTARQTTPPVSGAASTSGDSTLAGSWPSRLGAGARHGIGYAVTALVAASLGAGGGYRTGKNASSSVQGQMQQLRTEVAGTQSALAVSQSKTTEATSELTAERQREQQAQQQSDAGRGDLEKSVDQAQRNLVKVTADRDRSLKQMQALQAAVAAAQEKSRELEDSTTQRIRQAEAASAQRTQQLTTQLRERDSELASLKKRPVSSSGFLIWTGELKGKKTIDIQNGVPSMGTLSTGSLPGKPCTVVPADPSRVKIKGKPAPDNNWNRVSFEVSGNGPTDVRIYWTLF